MATRTLAWDFEGRRREVVVGYDREAIRQLRGLRHDIVDPARYEHYIANDPYLASVLTVIEDVAGLIRPGLSLDRQRDRTHLLEALLSLTQAVPYARDRGGEYPRYLSETLIDGCGDCEDSAILFVAFAVALGYECAFLGFGSEGFLGIGRWGHLDAGVAASFAGEFSGVHWTFDGVNYYYCGCNARGRAVGEEPDRRYERASIWPVFLRMAPGWRQRFFDGRL